MGAGGCGWVKEGVGGWETHVGGWETHVGGLETHVGGCWCCGIVVVVVEGGAGCWQHCRCCHASVGVTLVGGVPALLLLYL